MKNKLLNDIDALSLHLDNSQVDCLLMYLDLLAKWNKTYNLTAIKDRNNMLTQHIVDSLAILSPLKKTITSNNAKIMDVGSGGGLPGVVLAICEPDWQVLCIDAVEKKTSFINFAASSLQLNNLKAKHTRIETMPNYSADVIISRAFASLYDFTSLAGHHLHEQGWMVAMKGIYPNDEIANLREDWIVKKTEDIHVPRLNAQRCLVWMQSKSLGKR